MQNAHEFMFNFREIMSKMREFVYFETIFVNSATPSWAKQLFSAIPSGSRDNKKRNGSR